MWIKPDQTLTNELKEENNKSTERNTMLVPIPSSYSPSVPRSYLGEFNSNYFSLRQCNNSPRSSLLLFRDKGVLTPWGKRRSPWREAPRMKVARENAIAGALDGKIYVMGGCSADESASWAEVFDTKTQTWESLPDPGPELRSSLIKTMNVTKRRVYIECNEESDHYYNPKEGRWGVSTKAHKFNRKCRIDHISYSCGKRGFFWYDKKLHYWRMVQGLEVLHKYCCVGVVAMANYGEKLLVLWDKFEQKHDHCQNYKEIWCSVVALERRTGDDEVWGSVEWASVVLTVPSSYVFLLCQVKSV